MKTGDSVAWVDVPSGAMVAHDQALYVRIGGGGWCVGDLDFTTRCYLMFGRYSDGDACEPWPWEQPSVGQSVTILALGLTGSETKETLSMLVRHFEESSATRL